jgi:hypothetical protein
MFHCTEGVAGCHPNLLPANSVEFLSALCTMWCIPTKLQNLPTDLASCTHRSTVRYISIPLTKQPSPVPTENSSQSFGPFEFLQLRELTGSGGAWPKAERGQNWTFSKYKRTMHLIWMQFRVLFVQTRSNLQPWNALNFIIYEGINLSKWRKK